MQAALARAAELAVAQEAELEQHARRKQGRCASPSDEAEREVPQDMPQDMPQDAYVHRNFEVRFDDRKLGLRLIDLSAPGQPPLSACAIKEVAEGGQAEEGGARAGDEVVGVRLADGSALEHSCRDTSQLASCIASLPRPILFELRRKYGAGISPGALVEIKSLKSAPHLNGSKAVVRSWNEAKKAAHEGRWVIAVDGTATPLAIKPSNLKVVSSDISVLQADTDSAAPVREDTPPAHKGAQPAREDGRQDKENQQPDPPKSFPPTPSSESGFAHLPGTLAKLRSMAQEEDQQVCERSGPLAQKPRLVPEKENSLWIQ